jgi:hypothetical protein
MEDKQRKALLGKLRQPVHISYIAKYILKTSEEESIEILSNFIEEGIVEESEYAENYFVLVGPGGSKK